MSIKGHIQYYWPNVYCYHRIKDDRMEKYGCFIIFISKYHCRAAMKNVLADGRGRCIADGKLCRSRVASKKKFFVILLNFAKFFNFIFRKIFLKFREIQFFCVLRNSKNCCVSRSFDIAVSQPPYVGVE